MELGRKSAQQGKHEHMGRAPPKRAGNDQRLRTGFVFPAISEFSEAWEVAQHKRFPRLLTRTQKKRMLTERAASRSD